MTHKDPQIVVRVDAGTMVFTGTPEQYLISGTNPELVKQAKTYIAHPTQVMVNPKYPTVSLPTGGDTLLELALALVAVDPSSAVMLEAPEVVLETIRNPVEYLLNTERDNE